jgi:autotransporter-associated beta strand protein
VLGAVDRTLTLSGTNSQANTLSPVISNSAKGGKVNIVKAGTGTWLLEGVNTTTGTTTVEQGTLGGNGGVGGSLTVHGGAAFAPGGIGGASVGDFYVGGSFTLNDGATLALEMSGSDVGNVDLLTVAGSATLNGAISVSAIAFFLPDLGHQFTVLTAAGGVVGEFDATELPILDPGLVWAVHYEPTSVSLEVIASFPGDYNGNGIVDAADYTVWRDRLGQTFQLTNENPDDTNPGVVDQDDYTYWKSQFGQSVGSASAGVASAARSESLATVPEPATLVLLILVLAACHLVDRRR